MTIEIGLLLSIIGGLVGLAGWLSGRDKKISSDAEWKGTVNAKLDVIVGIKGDVARLEGTMQAHGERLTAVEASAKQAHRRIDTMENKGE